LRIGIGVVASYRRQALLALIALFTTFSSTGRFTAGPAIARRPSPGHIS